MELRAFKGEMLGRTGADSMRSSPILKCQLMQNQHDRDLQQCSMGKEEEIQAHLNLVPLSASSIAFRRLLISSISRTTTVM